MKRTTQALALITITLALSACGMLNSLIRTPPTDHSGTYADTNVDFGDICGNPHRGEVHLSIDSTVTEADASHELTLTTVIFDAGPGGQTLTNAATWTVNKDTNTLNSGPIADFGRVNLKHQNGQYAGTLTLFNVQCITPGQDPDQEDEVTYQLVTANFKATIQ